MVQAILLEFVTYPQHLHALVAAWLHACRIETVARQSTGVYGIPVSARLEARGFTVSRVTARPLTHGPGRQREVKACQWMPDGSVANFDFRGKIRKPSIRNSMTYRLQDSRKSNFATEPSGVTVRVWT